MERKETGFVKKFVRERGFGFLGRRGCQDLFFHISTLGPDDREKIQQGARVEFEVALDKNGRPAATNVTLVGVTA